MRRRGAVAAHLPIAGLVTPSSPTCDPVARSDEQMVWLAVSGHPVPEVTVLVGSSVKNHGVRTSVQRSTTEGPDGILSRCHTNPGATSMLSPAFWQELRLALMEASPDGERDAMQALGVSPHRPGPHAITVYAAALAAVSIGGVTTR